MKCAENFIFMLKNLEVIKNFYKFATIHEKFTGITVKHRKTESDGINFQLTQPRTKYAQDALRLKHWQKHRKDMQRKINLPYIIDDDMR